MGSAVPVQIRPLYTTSLIQALATCRFHIATIQHGGLSRYDSPIRRSGALALFSLAIVLFQ